MMNVLSERLRAIESGRDALLQNTSLDGKDDRDYVIRVANDRESREKAYRLVYRLYLEKEYARPNRSGMWLSIFDALPETTTLLAERASDGEAVGALTVVCDSPLGLPADELYGAELSALRAQGRRLTEIVSLGVAEGTLAGSELLVRLFNLAHLLAHRVREATDFVITVNPRHAGFYRRKLLFSEAGPMRAYEKVGGAPAVLFKIPLDTPNSLPVHKRQRTVYRFWLSGHDEARSVSALASALRPMSGAELHHFLTAQTDLLAEAGPERRAVLEQLCPALQNGEEKAPSPPLGDYSYAEATSRNLGLLTEAEQDALRGSTVAIAGLGAVGGHYLLTLARMGVGGFHIADPDHFEPANLHRQAGAFRRTLGRSKVEVMAEMVRDINPEVRIRTFSDGLTDENADEFLAGADLALDGIDFFQVDARRLLFRKARERGIHAITSGPIGFGATLQIFDPRGMTFDEYFGITAKMTRAERIAAFAVGLVPAGMAGNTMDASRIDFEREKGPALASSIMLCAGVMGTEVLRILLKRGSPRCVPHAFCFNPYLREYAQTHEAKGRAGWRERLFRWLAMRRFPSLLRLHRSERLAAGQARN